MASNQKLVDLVEVEDFSKILPRGVFLFLKNKSNNGGSEENIFQLQSKFRWGYSLEDVEDRILDLRERGKKLIDENKEGWRKLKKHMGGI